MNHDVSQTVNRCLLCGSEMMVGGTCLHCQSKLTANPVAKINQLEQRITSLERENAELRKDKERLSHLASLRVVDRMQFEITRLQSQNERLVEALQYTLYHRLPLGNKVIETLPEHRQREFQSLLTEIQKAKGRE